MSHSVMQNIATEQHVTFKNPRPYEELQAPEMVQTPFTNRSDISYSDFHDAYTSIGMSQVEADRAEECVNSLEELVVSCEALDNMAKENQDLKEAMANHREKLQTLAQVLLSLQGTAREQITDCEAKAKDYVECRSELIRLKEEAKAKEKELRHLKNQFEKAVTLSLSHIQSVYQDGDIEGRSNIPPHVDEPDRNKTSLRRKTNSAGQKEVVAAVARNQQQNDRKEVHHVDPIVEGLEYQIRDLQSQIRNFKETIAGQKNSMIRQAQEAQVQLQDLRLQLIVATDDVPRQRKIQELQSKLRDQETLLKQRDQTIEKIKKRQLLEPQMKQAASATKPRVAMDEVQIENIRLMDELYELQKHYQEKEVELEEAIKQKDKAVRVGTERKVATIDAPIIVKPLERNLNDDHIDNLIKFYNNKLQAAEMELNKTKEDRTDASVQVKHLEEEWSSLGLRTGETIHNMIGYDDQQPQSIAGVVAGNPTTTVR